MKISELKRSVKKNRKIAIYWLVKEFKMIYRFVLKYSGIFIIKCQNNKYCRLAYGKGKWFLVKLTISLGWLSKPAAWLWKKFLAWFTEILYKYRWLKPTRQFFRDLKKFFFPPTGSLPWKNLVKISYKNLIHGQSRTIVTVGGVAVGVGAIVLLVSFAYGLQEIITNRIIWPDALKVAEAVAESTSVKVNKEMVDKMRGFNGVVKTAESIRLAGQVDFSDSKIDVVVVGADRQYLNLSNIKLIEGEGFSDKSDERYTGVSQIEQMLAGINVGLGEVAGVSSEELVETKLGDVVDGAKIRFKLREEMYIPVYTEAKASAIVGYVKGNVVNTFDGVYVWGEVYSDLSGLGRVAVDGTGVMGKWMRATMPMWERIDGESYREVFDGDSKRFIREVYFQLSDVKELSVIEQKVDELINDEGMVLGEMDGQEASEAASLLSNELSVGTEAARLADKIFEQKASEEALREEVVLKVWDESSQEMLINDSILRAWNKQAKDVLGKEVKIRYLISGSVVPGVAGRVLSEEMVYKIVGIAEGGDKPLVYTPIGDLESLGIENYSSVKVLVENEDYLPEVRAKIQDLGLVSKSVVDTLIQINRLFNIMRFLLASFGAIALLVALFGMFNTMTVSLLERTREIGVMKSLGTSNLDVVRIFLAEAFLISALGGIVGIVGGNMLGAFVDKFIFKFSSRVGQAMFVMPLRFALLVFGVALFVGLLTGWYPSKRASKISALNALRYE